MSTDVLAIDALIVSRLTLDATMTGLVGNRVYSDVAPEGAPFPFVVFSLTSAPAVRGVGVTSVMTNALYTVKAVSDTASHAALQPIAARLDDLLVGAWADANAYGTVLAGAKEETVRFTLLEDGRQYRHLGAVYRFHSH